MTNGCGGHPAGPGDPMGVTVYCDGTCKPKKTLASAKVERQRQKLAKLEERLAQLMAQRVIEEEKLADLIRANTAPHADGRAR